MIAKESGKQNAFILSLTTILIRIGAICAIYATECVAKNRYTRFEFK